MSSVVAGFIEGFFGRILSRFTTQDLLKYINENLDLVEYTRFDKHRGTYNFLVPLLNRLRPYSVHIVLPLINQFLTIERILFVINRIKDKGPEWIDILTDVENPKGYFWLKRNISEIKEWAMHFFADPNFYGQTPLEYRPDNGDGDSIDKRFQGHT